MPAACPGRHPVISAEALDQRPGAMRAGGYPAEGAHADLEKRTCAGHCATFSGGRNAVRMGRRRCRIRQGTRFPAGAGRDERGVSLPTSTASSGSGPNSLSLRFHLLCRGMGARRRSGEPRGNRSRWKAWSRGSARATGRAASCVTAPAANCGSISHTGGSGCGMARKRRFGAGI